MSRRECSPAATYSLKLTEAEGYLPRVSKVWRILSAVFRTFHPLMPSAMFLPFTTMPSREGSRTVFPFLSRDWTALPSRTSSFHAIRPSGDVMVTEGSPPERLPHRANAAMPLKMIRLFIECSFREYAARRPSIAKNTEGGKNGPSGIPPSRGLEQHRRRRKPRVVGGKREQMDRGGDKGPDLPKGAQPFKFFSAFPGPPGVCPPERCSPDGGICWKAG